MKKCLMIVLISAGIAVAVHAYEVSVGTNSIVIAPERNMYGSQSYRAWQATNAYANGQYASIGNAAHMCLVGGTSSTNAPTAGADVVQDGTVTWVRIASGNDRRFCLVKKVSGSTAVMLGFGRNATTNSGFVLSFNGAGVTLDSLDAYRGEISAVSADGTNTLIVGDN